MLDITASLLDLNAPAPDANHKLTRDEKRAAIELALLADPDRSDNAIASELGVDPKTVKARRLEIPNGNSQPGGPNSKVGIFDDGNSQLGNSNSPPPPVMKAEVPAVNPRDDGCEFDWYSDDASIVLREQLPTAVYFNPAGDLVIRQRNWPDEDSLIIITEPFQQAFLDRLSDFMGIPSVGGGAR